MVLVLPACGNHKEQTEVVGEEKIYVATGNVVFVEASKKRIKIRHDDIDGFMMSMTMWFAVKDDAVVEKMKGFLRGNRVSFELVKVGDNSSYVRDIKKIAPLKPKEHFPLTVNRHPL